MVYCLNLYRTLSQLVAFHEYMRVIYHLVSYLAVERGQQLRLGQTVVENE